MNKLQLRAYWACNTCWNSYNECECLKINQETNLQVNEILWTKNYLNKPSKVRDLILKAK